MKKYKKLIRETNPFREVKTKYDEKKYIQWVNAFEPIKTKKSKSKKYYD